MMQHAHTGERSLSDLFAMQEFVERIRPCFCRLCAGMFGFALALDPASRLWSSRPEQQCIHRIGDKPGASEVRFSATLCLDQRPKGKDIVDAWRISAQVTIDGLERKAETEVESNQKALNAVDPAFEPFHNLPASPARSGRRCDQFRRALTAPARRDCNSIVTSG